MTTAKKVVADDALLRFGNKQWELERRIREGSLDAPTVCAGLQILIEGGTVLPNVEDLRVRQAWRYYDVYGIGEEFGLTSFTDYLETIPPVPVFPDHYRQHFDRLALVENRLPIKHLCNALGIVFGGDDETFIPYDPACVKADPMYWMLYQDGRKNRNESVQLCRKEFQSFEIGLNATEGCCAYAQDRRHLLEEGIHIMDLPGSVLRGGRDGAAFLGLLYGRPGLVWDAVDDAGPRYGSASRGE